VVSAAAACALVVLGAGSASAAKPALSGGSWGAGVEAALPANAAQTKNDGAGVESVSCPSAGNCSAVGGYTDSSGYGEGLLLTETAGTWAIGVEAVLPANEDRTLSPSSFGAVVRSVSCASAGNCSAIGTYFDSSGNQEGLLLTETAGTWSAGVEAALPPNAVALKQFVQWGSVSCASAGNCTAVGQYTAAGSFFQGLMLTETDGTWAAGVEATPTATDSWLDSVSCASAGNCTAVGAYVDGSSVQQGLLLTETNGTWATEVKPTLPPDNQNLGAELDSVSCASAGNCTAVGLYDVSSLFVGRDEMEFRGKGLLLTETAGSWGAGVEAPLPANADATYPVDPIYPPSVSCSSAGNCSAVGGYYDNSSDLQGVLLTETAGTWATGVEALPATTDGGTGFINSISCSSPGNCGALLPGGELVTETAGTWGAGAEPSVPANARGPGALLYSVSCGSADNCSAVGSYEDSSGHQGGLLIGGSPASVTLDVSKNGTGSGSVSSVPAGIDCGTTCSASFDAGTSLTLTATPSPGSYFSGFSGDGCSGKSCRPTTDISEQTVTADFRLLPNCVVPKVRGKTLRAATVAIRNHHCAVGKITHARSRTIKEGRVISEKPKRGSRLQHGAKVSLLVSEGKR
jgi:hypothetical protein